MLLRPMLAVAAGENGMDTSCGGGCVNCDVSCACTASSMSSMVISFAVGPPNACSSKHELEFNT